MTATTDRPATLDRDDARDIAAHVLTDALHEHDATIHHGDAWHIDYLDDGYKFHPIRDGVRFRVSDDNGRQVWVTVMATGMPGGAA